MQANSRRRARVMGTSEGVYTLICESYSTYDALPCHPYFLFFVGGVNMETVVSRILDGQVASYSTLYAAVQLGPIQVIDTEITLDVKRPMSLSYIKIPSGAVEVVSNDDARASLVRAALTLTLRQSIPALTPHVAGITGWTKTQNELYEMPTMGFGNREPGVSFDIVVSNTTTPTAIASALFQ